MGEVEKPVPASISLKVNTRGRTRSSSTISLRAAPKSPQALQSPPRPMNASAINQTRWVESTTASAAITISMAITTPVMGFFCRNVLRATMSPKITAPAEPTPPSMATMAGEMPRWSARKVASREMPNPSAKMTPNCMMIRGLTVGCARASPYEECWRVAVSSRGGDEMRLNKTTESNEQMPAKMNAARMP